MKYILFIFVIMFCHITAMNGQTYATPELKAQAEKWENEKNDLESKKNTFSRNNVFIEHQEIIKPNSLSFILAKVIPVVINDSIRPNELNNYNQDAMFEMSTYEIFIDWEKKLTYTRNKFTNNQNVTDISFIEIKNPGETYNCANCGSLIYCKMISENSLVFRYQSQDNQYVYYDYVFKKITL